MAAVKVTFTLDPVTVARLQQAADRLHMAKSAVVREAIRDYAERVGRLGEAERLRLLQVFDTVVPRIGTRPAADVDAEIDGIRAARRGGGRRSTQ